MPKYYCFTICFFLSVQLISSQEIKGLVKDNFMHPIQHATIQLVNRNTNKIISFKQTNEKGEFKISVDVKNLPLILKTNHISFETQEILIENYNELSIVFSNN
jgi:hypothetical protein